MSYILDALRKSSEERRRIKQSEQAGSPLPLMAPRKKKRSSLRIIITGLLIIVLMGIGGSVTYFFLKQDQPRSTKNTIPEPAPPAEKESVVQAEPSPAPLTEQPAVQKTEAKPEPKPEPQQKKPAVSGPVPLKEDLPEGIRAAIPDMKFSGHVYSPTPSLRLIMIDTNIVREGGSVNDELILEEITENGLIFSYKGTRYKEKLF